MHPGSACAALCSGRADGRGIEGDGSLIRATWSSCQGTSEGKQAWTAYLALAPVT